MTTDMGGLAAVLSAEFEPKEVLHFTKEWTGKDGRQHSRTFDYIEDETVMDRLDDVVGLGRHSWEFMVVSDVCVKGQVTIAWPDGTSSFYQDFGYATRPDSAEPLKEAVSDAIRRIGRYVGIARYLYRKHDSTSGSGRGSAPSQPRPSAPPRPTVVADVPEGPPLFDEPEFAPIGGKSSPVDVPTDVCPIHDEPWRGERGDLYHGPKGIVDGGYCRHPDNVKKARARA